MSAGSRKPRRIDLSLAERGGALELLRLPAALFSLAVRIRGALYDRRRLPVMKLETPVVSVGNVSAGGTGKTPMTVWLARRCQARGLRPGILSRGYRAGSGSAGDEAQLLRRLLPGVPHVQNPDRVAGGQELEGLGVDVILLDDGFQHRRLARDLDLVLVDASRPWGLPAPRAGGAPLCAALPRGLMREAARALARADLLVLTRVDQVAPGQRSELCAELERLAPGIPILSARHVPVALRRLLDGDLGEVPMESLAGLEVDLISGIGNPAAFEGVARELVGGIASHREFPDHHDYAARDLQGLGQRAVLTTGKDAVKLMSMGLELYVLDVELTIVDGREALEERLDGLPVGARRRERLALHEGLHG